MTFFLLVLSRFYLVTTSFFMTRVQLSRTLHEAFEVRVQHLVFRVHLILRKNPAAVAMLCRPVF